MRMDLLVEGYVDAEVASRVLAHCNHEIGTTYGKKGWNYVVQKIDAFDKSLGAFGLLTLIDYMDTGAVCPGAAVQKWLPHPAAAHVFRLVVREIESWILADRQGIADFLGISVAKIPLNPEEIQDPKRHLVNLARGARSKALRDALVPKVGHAASEGPLYSTELGRFVSDRWNPVVARTNSRSLARCIDRLNQLHEVINGGI